MNRVRIAIPLVFLLVVVALLAMQREKSSVHVLAKRASGSIDFNAEVAFWSNRIRTTNPQEAYGEMASSVASLSLKNQHFEAHTFGEALFDTKTSPSSLACDLRFGQGCFHQYFGDYVHEFGLAQGLDTFAASCTSIEKISDRRTCEHGIGHGLLGYAGYTVDGLKQALTLCRERVHSTDYTLGCAGGVFMEYNLRTLLLGDAEENPRRVLTTESTYTPCLGLSDTDTASCMFWQPVWWFLELRTNASIDDAIRTMGAYCDRSDSAISKRACFRGLGYSLPLYSQDAATVERWCASVSANASDRLACWSYARPQVTPNEKNAEAQTLCAGVTGPDESACEKGAGTSAAFNGNIDPLR